MNFYVRKPELADYLDKFLQGLSGADRAFTAHIERETLVVCDMIRQNPTNPTDIELERARRFLLDVEKWKADCLEELTGNAARNSRRQIWDALNGAINASNDSAALLAIMNLVGFGSSKDGETGLRRAKRATAVLRFLDPGQWGVVDWRTISILTFYEKHGFDMDLALQEARKWGRGQVASLFDLIDEKMAVDVVKKYRSMRNKKLPRTVDVELALYGTSFLAWPRRTRVTHKKY